MHFTTTIRAWECAHDVEGMFNPLAEDWIHRFDAPAVAEPLGDGAISTLFDDMRVEGMRFYLDGSRPPCGYRWLIKDLGTGLFYLVEPASPRHYGAGLAHVEINARRLSRGPTGL